MGRGVGLAAAQLARLRAVAADALLGRGGGLLTRLDRRDRLLALALAAIAGFVDATGFLASKGYFVSFMSGNSTRFGIATGEGIAAMAVVGAIIAAFVAGVAGATRLRRAGGGRKALLLVIAALLAVAGAAAAGAIAGAPRLLVGVACMASAMGAANVVLADEGPVRLGLTYMTGALVRLGEGLGGLGGEPGAWRWHAALWIALVAGCALGAALFGLAGVRVVWAAAGAVLFLAAIA